MGLSDAIRKRAGNEVGDGVGGREQPRGRAPESEGDRTDRTDGTDKGNPKWKALDGQGFITQIEVDVVCSGVLQRLTLGGLAPTEVAAFLREIDPQVQFRDSFPVRGGGKRDTKDGVCLFLQGDVKDAGAFWKLVCQSGDETVTVDVSKRRSGTFVEDVIGLGCLGDGSVERLRKIIETKGAITLPLVAAEQFGVRYWVSDDGSGRAYMDSMEARNDEGNARL